MKISNVTNIYTYPTNISDDKKALKKQDIKDVYIRFQTQQTSKKNTYENLAPKIDTATIQKLKEDSEKAYNQLRELVRQLLEKQGLSFKDIM